MKAMKALLLTLALAPSLASAEPAQHRAWSTNAAGVCHPALPIYDNVIRMRPLAAVNEGDVSGFVTCALPIDMANDNGLEVAYAVLRNQTAATVTIRCTGVYGVDDGAARYDTRTINVPAGSRRMITFEGEDFGVESLRNRVGLSCNLPPFTGVNELGTEEKL